MKLESALVFDRSPREIAVAYLCLGASFVVAADLAVASAVGTLSAWTPVRAVGGWTVVAASSLVVYGATAHHRRRAATARSNLETSNQQLQVLSRVFRHNVRNDLNIIQGYTDLLVDRVDDERSRECLETIRETTDDVVEISEKLRVIEDASPAAPEGRVDLVDTVNEAAAEIDRADVALTVDAPAEAWVHADESIEYPVREVFENAVTHNDESVRRVDVRITETGSTVCLEVRDNGPGIPEDERAVLRAEEETPLSHASSIGLWLVKWMCETQGGTVGFETSDGGTTVRLRFESFDGPTGAGADSAPARESGREGSRASGTPEGDAVADGIGKGAADDD
ncbi:two-component sensor histidine kinase [Halorubrum salipaludis]|uniref:histidine kinase n=1 Tax=Halorubrum salipaludis TaxID=2032630 RepID=A0A2A2FFX6_9EURY|nr:HAMP domain-containing sensor histidine kinase [Halorubrum salipaludis]PAU83552.1 two-component sensor histidine kinase [Halorubrum salipaludis]